MINILNGGGGMIEFCSWGFEGGDSIFTLKLVVKGWYLALDSSWSASKIFLKELYFSVNYIYPTKIEAWF